MLPLIKVPTSEKIRKEITSLLLDAPVELVGIHYKTNEGFKQTIARLENYLLAQQSVK